MRLPVSTWNDLRHRFAVSVVNAWWRFARSARRIRDVGDPVLTRPLLKLNSCSYLIFGGGRLLITTARGAPVRDVISGTTGAASDARIQVEVLDAERPPAGAWDLFSAGVYEDDVAAVRQAQGMANSAAQRAASIQMGSTSGVPIGGVSRQIADVVGAIVGL